MIFREVCFPKLISLLIIIIFNNACNQGTTDNLIPNDKFLINEDPNGYSLYGFGENQVNEFGNTTLGFFNKSKFLTSNVIKVLTYGNSTAIIKSDSSFWISENAEFKKLIEKVKDAAISSTNIYFIDIQNKLYGLGSNSRGQLGRDNYGGNFSNPKYIDSDVISVSAGLDYLMYIKDDFTLWGLGDNFGNQIHPEFVADFIYPQKVMENIKKVRCSNYLTLFLDKNNNMYGVGDNYNNRFGIKDMKDNSSIKEPFLIKGDINNFAIGDGFLLFVDNKGILYGCGINSHGQLNSKPSEHYYREPISPKIITENVANIAAGNSHSLVLKKDGSLWSCGKNSSGQLGDGTFFQSNKLIRIDSKVKNIFSSSEHSLILK
ncbi:RCC1 domain-containing protein [Arundinibacter roseus]|uniref:Chromosome condensation regulator n=1 Tax=Arundinibacter roseus TaxID=2070510 RepID=A0A4R4KQC5_9BACT|nr:hypothetical protein [Arundinibacter roseus]TDB69166.1 hypothetical protein EZE20_02180 [Arundinibacter roseus]